MKTLSSIHRGPGAVLRFAYTCLFLIALAHSFPGTAQNPEGFTIRGRVALDDDNTPLSGVNIYLKNTTVGVASDEKGQFTFPRVLKTGDVMVFSFLGLEKVEYTVPATDPGFLEIRMRFESILIRGELSAEPNLESTTRRLKRKF